MTIIYEYFEKICKDTWPSISNGKAPGPVAAFCRFASHKVCGPPGRH